MASANILVPKNEDAWLEFQTDKWTVKLKIVFEASEKDESRFTLTPTADHAILTFINWKGPLPGGVAEPQGFFKGDEDKTLYFVCSGYALGEANQIFMQFFWGE